MLAVVFPGQGSQFVGMGKDLSAAYPTAARAFAEADAALSRPLSRLCFEGPAEELELTANQQPAILATSIAYWRVVSERVALAPALAAGHSLGEYTALVAAGSLDFAAAVRLVGQRGTFMQEAVPAGEGAMAAVLGLDRNAVLALCAEAAEGAVLVPANFNSPGQIVISGHAPAVSRAVSLAKQRGGVAKLLKVSAPFHSPLMRPAADRLHEALAAFHFKQPRFPILSNVDAAPVQTAEEIVPRLVQQMASPVLWDECTRQLAARGATRIVEFGGDTLIKLIKRTAPGIELLAVNCVAVVEQLLTGP